MTNGNVNGAPAGAALGPVAQHVAAFEQVISTPSTHSRVTMREFDTASTSSHLDSFVSTSLDHNEKTPAVAAANGKFVVAWVDMQVNFGDILAQVFKAADGSKIGGTIPVNLTAPAGVQKSPQVAANAAGDVLFVWESSYQGVNKISALLYPRLLAP